MDFSTIEDARSALDRGDVSSVALTEAFLARIESTEPALSALITVTADRALEDARAADERISRGESEPLLGIPIVLKGIFATRGI